MKRILVGTVLMIMALPCYAAGENVTTSQNYVDAALELKQATIPAAGASGVGAGNTVMTYTATSGTIGERALYTDASSYDASTDADKMITASALNGAITSMPTTTTTKLTCANAGTCDLWSITDQTAYAGAAANTGIDLMTLIGTVTGNDYTSGSGNTFSVDYGNKGTITGKAQCSTQEGTDDPTWSNPTISSTLPDSEGQYCYCMLDGYIPDGGTLQNLSSPWVFYENFPDFFPGMSMCPSSCATNCAYSLRHIDSSLKLAFRAAMFGVTH